MRELAMQALFLWDTNGERDIDLARPILEDGAPDDESSRRAALEMATGTWEHRAVIDAQVNK